MNTRHLLLLITAVALSPAQLQAEPWQFSADAGIELRAFADDAALPGQDDDAQISGLLNLEWRWRSDDGSQRASIQPFLRLDSVDSERTHADLREAYWAFEGEDWEVLAGVNKVFWGVTESRHLIDIINQTDLVEDPDQEDKLGQPMVNLSLQRDWGKLDFYLLPYFRERTFAGTDGRLREPLVVDTDAVSYESSSEQNHVDLAVRYSHYFGSVDVGLYLFDGTSREPRLLPSSTGEGLQPFYEQITQTGLDLQYTGDAWLWKLEAMHRDGLDDSFFAAIAGFEYTRFQVADSNADLGFLVEYLYDGRDTEAAPTAFDDDIFIGSRLTLNDTQDSNLLAGVVYDPDSSETFFNVEAERRFGDNIKAELRLRTFTGADPEEALFSIERDDYLQLRITRYF